MRTALSFVIAAVLALPALSGSALAQPGPVRPGSSASNPHPLTPGHGLPCKMTASGRTGNCTNGPPGGGGGDDYGTPAQQAQCASNCVGSGPSSPGQDEFCYVSCYPHAADPPRGRKSLKLRREPIPIQLGTLFPSRS